MVPAADAPLRLISRKFIKAQVPKTPNNKNRDIIGTKWLRPTIQSNGTVSTAYKPLWEALRRLPHRDSEIKEFRELLRAKDYSDAISRWHTLVRQTRDNNELKPPSVLRWKSIVAETKSYGPSSFLNSLNDISRHNRQAPSLVTELVTPLSSPLDPFILGYVVSKLGKWDVDLACRILSNQDWNNESKEIGCVALLDAVNCDPKIILRLGEQDSMPKGCVLPSFLVSKLANQRVSKDLIDAFEHLASRDLLPCSSSTDQLLRRIYSGSDYGAQMVRTCMKSMSRVPWQFFPFIVQRLCERINQGEESAKQELDELFDSKIADLASTQPSLVLHLLVMRLIATDGVQSTAPVLNRWVASDPNGVSESTWLLLFQAFRRLGRPDKCSEVLSRVLESGTKLSLPFVGEYLMYIAQFQPVQEYLARLIKVIPEMQPILRYLGITEYVSALPTSSGELIITDRHEVNDTHRDFYVKRIHESWLTITYQAVLANVETSESAASLFHKYLDYVAIVSRSPTSLRVTDQFVTLICGLPDRRIDLAEQIFRTALQRIKIKQPVDGKNHAKSLETLCFKLVQAGQVSRAIQLLVDANANHGVTVGRTTIEPWIRGLPTNVQKNLSVWANDHAGVVLGQNH